MASRGDIDLSKVQPELFEGWLQLQLEEVLEKTGVFTKLKAKDCFDEGTFPVVDQGEKFISGYVNDEKLIYKGEVPVVVFGDHTRVVKYVDFEFAAGADGTKILKPFEFLDSKFFFYYLKSLSVPSLGYSRHFSIIKSIGVPLPPLVEQKRIVAKLDEAFQHLDTLKAKLERIPELLKNFRQSVLTQAVTGKLTEEWRDGNLDIETAQLLINRVSEERKIRYLEAVKKAKEFKTKKPSEFDNFEVILNGNFDLFDLPDSWEWVDFRYTMAEDKPFCYGVVQPGLDDLSGNLLIRAGDLENGSVNTTSLRTISKSIDEEYTRSRVEGGEILVTLVGANVGDVAIVPESCSGYNIARALAKAPVKDFHSKYIYTWLSSSTCKYWMKSQSREVARPTLNLEQLRTIPIPLPPLEEQKEIFKRVEALFAKADAIEAYYANLKEKIDKLPQALLAKAFRGELVPQDSNDEPASVLLEKIKAAKAAATSSAKDKKSKGSKQAELAL